MNYLNFYTELPSQFKASIVVCIIIVVFSLVIGSKAKNQDPSKSSKGLLFFGELIVDGMNNFCKNELGNKWRQFSPFVTMVMLFIVCSIGIGFFGFKSPLTSPIITLTLSSITVALVHISGVRVHGLFSYFAGMLADPTPAMAPLNIIGELSKPISLGLRIFGNILSGAIIMSLVYGLTALAGGLLGGLINFTQLEYILPVFVAPIFHAVFDIFLGGIQVLVFLSLTVVFLALAVDEGEEVSTQD